MEELWDGSVGFDGLTEMKRKGNELVKFSLGLSALRCTRPANHNRTENRVGTLHKCIKVCKSGKQIMLLTA